MSFFIYLIFLLNRTHFSTTLTVTYACLLTFVIVEDKQTSEMKEIEWPELKP